MRVLLLSSAICVLLLNSCSYMLPQAGPTTTAIVTADKSITILDLSPRLVYKLKSTREDLKKKLREFLSSPYSPKIGKGDTLEIYIYESPPPVFLASLTSVTSSSGVTSVALPPQMVDDEGYISVPFVGRIYVLGKRPEEVAKEIENKLKKIANNPQVIVKVNFVSSTVTIFGQVRESKRIPLSYNVTTLLDVLALAGGVTSPINKTLIKISRNGQTITLPLEDVLRNPELNIHLQPGDVINVVYKTQSATILGATGLNTELEFEAKGITLSQALGRVGGLKDNLAHAKGLFIFRFEDRKLLEKLKIRYYAYTKDGKVPVIYRVDMSNPTSFFVLKEFQVKDGDIIYVSTAPAVQLNKFLTLIRDIIQPIFMIKVLSR